MEEPQEGKRRSRRRGARGRDEARERAGASGKFLRPRAPDPPPPKLASESLRLPHRRAGRAMAGACARRGGTGGGGVAPTRLGCWRGCSGPPAAREVARECLPEAALLPPSPHRYPAFRSSAPYFSSLPPILRSLLPIFRPSPPSFHPSVRPFLPCLPLPPLPAFPPRPRCPPFPSCPPSPASPA